MSKMGKNPLSLPGAVVAEPEGFDPDDTDQVGSYMERFSSNLICFVIPLSLLTVPSNSKIDKFDKITYKLG